MHRDDGIRLGHAWVAALGRADAAALGALFAPAGAYMDGLRPGWSRGAERNRHFETLCTLVRGAQVSPLDVLVDHESVCVRWVGQQTGTGHVLEAVTWLRCAPDGVEEGRTFMDGAAFLGTEMPAPTPAPVPQVGGPLQPGKPLGISGKDSRGRSFNTQDLAGRVVCLLAASRRTQAQAQAVAEALGQTFGGDARVVLVLILDGTDVPSLLRGVALTALGSLRAQAVRRFVDGFERKGLTPPNDVDALVWLLPDFDGGLLQALGLTPPLGLPVLVVVNPQGVVVGRWEGQAADMAAAGVAAAQSVLPSAS